jgi:hypothetical protein
VIKLNAIFDRSAADHLQETPLSHDQPSRRWTRSRPLAGKCADTPQLRWWLLASATGRNRGAGGAAAVRADDHRHGRAVRQIVVQSTFGGRRGCDATCRSRPLASAPNFHGQCRTTCRTISRSATRLISESSHFITLCRRVGMWIEATSPRHPVCPVSRTRAAIATVPNRFRGGRRISPAPRFRRSATPT